MKYNMTIFSDYIWPFCYIGKGIVDELKKEFDIEDTWLPLEIHPDTPHEGKELTEMFPKDKLVAMTSNLKNYGAQFGLEFNQLKVLSNSHLSLIAGEYARDHGKFHEYHEEIFKAYFTFGEDIGKMEVINKILNNLNLDTDKFASSIKENLYEDKLKQASSAAHINEINSTPTFIINNKYAVIGAQPLDSFKKVLLDMEQNNI